MARVIPFTVRTVQELGLPPAIEQIAEEERGLILLTGTTGSGKSTTLAAIINWINENKARHIVTIEDPIEYLHRDRQSIINQREVGMDTESFGRAMRRVLRQDPDVILIGEMRDEETVRTALSAAETGHLVLSTVHTLDAAESVNRIIDFFQPHEQGQARAMLAGTLKAVVSQRLVRTADRQGRVAVCEILRMTGRAHDMILDPEQTDRLREVIAEGEYYGMQTFDQALLKHYQAGRITIEDAMAAASSPHDFKLLVAGEGRDVDLDGGSAQSRAPRRVTADRDPCARSGRPCSAMLVRQSRRRASADHNRRSTACPRGTGGFRRPHRACSAEPASPTPRWSDCQKSDDRRIEAGIGSPPQSLMAWGESEVRGMVRSTRRFLCGFGVLAAGIVLCQLAGSSAATAQDQAPTQRVIVILKNQEKDCRLHAALIGQRRYAIHSPGSNHQPAIDVRRQERCIPTCRQRGLGDRLVGRGIPAEVGSGGGSGHPRPGNSPGASDRAGGRLEQRHRVGAAGGSVPG